MSEAKHSKGEWSVYPGDYPGIDCNTEERSVSIVVYRNDEDDGDAGIDGFTKEERMANATLMATAPKLLEALERIKQAYDQQDENEMVCRVAESFPIIAKAKGQTDD